MKTSDAERLRKVQALYDRATSPGEKAAAFEALSRIRETAERWKDEVTKILTGHGFYRYMSGESRNGPITGFVRRFKEEYVELIENQSGGTWYLRGNYGNFEGTDSDSLNKQLTKRKGV